MLTKRQSIFGFFAIVIVVFSSCTRLIEILPIHQPPVTPPTPPVSNVHLNDGLLAYFNFSGNWADSSGNGNNGDATSGVTLTTDKQGHSNSAYASTGNGERLIVNNNGSIYFDTAFSISVDALIHTYGSEGFASIVNRTSALGTSFGFGLGIPGDPHVNFAVADNSLTCNDHISSSNSLIDSSNLVMNLDTWYNMIAIFHKGTLKIYANGQLLVTKTGGSDTAAFCENSQLIIGGWWDADPQSINGKLDNVRLYNRVLNDDEIKELSKGF